MEHLIRDIWITFPHTITGMPETHGYPNDNFAAMAMSAILNTCMYLMLSKCSLMLGVNRLLTPVVSLTMIDSFAPRGGRQQPATRNAGGGVGREGGADRPTTGPDWYQGVTLVTNGSASLPHHDAGQG